MLEALQEAFGESRQAITVRAIRCLSALWQATKNAGGQGGSEAGGCLTGQITYIIGGRGVSDTAKPDPSQLPIIKEVTELIRVSGCQTQAREDAKRALRGPQKSKAAFTSENLVKFHRRKQAEREEWRKMKG